ncbi:DMT family transporter [Streptomyces polyrhachis]|uniref:DMT family transporter n=1 Tax=Streptomyces polyrhachis TaxID=1282885 RepID=A0ABW2GIC3_9ACTN
MSSFLFALLLSLVSATAYAGAAVLQERAASSQAAAQSAAPSPARPPLRDRGWWASVALNGSGALLHVAALAYGSLSLVQPLGALTIVFALPLAALFAGKRADRTAWAAALMCTVGLVVILALTGSGPSHPMSGQWQAAVAGGTVAAVGTLTLAAGRLRHRPKVRSLTLATAAGTAFGMASVFTKALLDDPADPLSLVMVAVLATGGLLLSQAAYRGAGLAAPLATLTVVNPVVAAAVGIAAMGESFRYGAQGAVGVLIAGTVAAAGVFVLTGHTEQAAAPVARVSRKSGAPRPERVPLCAAPPRMPGLAHARSRGDLRRSPRPAHRLLGAGRERRPAGHRERPGASDVRAPDVRAPEPAAAARRGP